LVAAVTFRNGFDGAFQDAILYYYVQALIYGFRKVVAL